MHTVMILIVCHDYLAAFTIVLLYVHAKYHEYKINIIICHYVTCVN